MPRPRYKTRCPHATEAEVMRGVADALASFGAQVDAERQNTGGMYDARGNFIRFGRPGNADWTGTIKGGRRLAIECKRGGFAPSRARGKERERFLLQLDRLKTINKLGGLGFWTSDPADVVQVLAKALASPAWGIVFDEEDYPVLTLTPRSVAPF